MIAQSSAPGAPCRAEVSTVAPGTFAGERIASITLATKRTRPTVVRRELRFVPGDTVDTLRIAQSLRQVRALGYVDDVRVEARRCTGDAGVALRIVTHDRRATTPLLRVKSAGGLLGVRERNVLGTGITARVAVRSDGSRLGVESAVTAPGLPMADGTIDAGVVRYADGNAMFAAIAPRSPWPTSAWIVDARLAAREQEPRSAAGIIFHHTAGEMLVGHRLPDRAGSMYLLAGIEGENASVATALGTPVLGASSLERHFVGAAVELRRAVARFDTTSWLLPNGRLADVPHGWEGDALVSVGRDHTGRLVASHADLWLGRAATFASGRAIVVADGWAAGYFGDDLLAASTLRGSVNVVRQAARGYWSMRLGGERLIGPDPDVRALSMLDPLTPILPRQGRLAEAAVAASVERDVRLRALTRTTALDGALFVAGTSRWDPQPDANAERLALVAAGIGLRVVPGHADRSTLRLDVGFPLARTSGVRRGVYIGASVVPSMFGGRERSGRRLP